MRITRDEKRTVQPGQRERQDNIQTGADKMQVQTIGPDGATRSQAEHIGQRLTFKVKQEVKLTGHMKPKKHEPKPRS